MKFSLKKYQKIILIVFLVLIFLTLFRSFLLYRFPPQDNGVFREGDHWPIEGKADLNIRVRGVEGSVYTILDSFDKVGADYVVFSGQKGTWQKTHFINHPIQNLRYRNIYSDSDSEVYYYTKSDGTVFCRIGDTLEFYAGHIFLGTTECSFRTITPFDLIPSNAPKTAAQDLLRFLQSLDLNNNINDGIEIDNDGVFLHEKLIKQELTPFDYNNAPEFITQELEKLSKELRGERYIEVKEKFENLSREKAEENFYDYRKKMDEILEKTYAFVRTLNVYKHNDELHAVLEYLKENDKIIVIDSLKPFEDKFDKQGNILGQAFPKGYYNLTEHLIRIEAHYSNSKRTEEEKLKDLASSLLHEARHVLDYQKIIKGEIEKSYTWEREFESFATGCELFRVGWFTYIFHGITPEELFYKKLCGLYKDYEEGDWNEEKEERVKKLLVKDRHYRIESLEMFITSEDVDFLRPLIIPKVLTEDDIKTIEDTYGFDYGNIQKCRTYMKDREKGVYYYYISEADELIFNEKNYGKVDLDYPIQTSAGTIVYKKGNNLFYNEKLLLKI